MIEFHHLERKNKMKGKDKWMFDCFDFTTPLNMKGEQVAGAVAWELSNHHGFEVEVVPARKFVQLQISCPVNLGRGIDILTQYWEFWRGEEYGRPRVEQIINLIIDNAKRSGGIFQ